MAFPNPGIPTLLSAKRRRRALKLSHWKAAMMGGAAVLTMATGVTPAGVAATIGNAVDLQQHFQLDGNITSADPTSTYPAACDWATVNAGTCADTAMFDHTGVINDQYVNGKDPSAFTTGSQDVDNINTWGCTVKPFDAKNNILNTYAAAFLVPKSGDGTHRVVYMGQERESNNGNAFAGFWLLHTSVGCTPPATGSSHFSGSHTDGDLLVVSNYTNGGGTNAVDIYAWEHGALNQTPVFVSASTCASPTDVEVACAIPNTSALSAPSWGPQALDTNEFVETGVDLTAVDELLASANPPLTGLSSCFTNFMSETRSSQSATADLHDYALGQTHTCPTPGLPTDDTTNGHVISGTVGSAMAIGDSVTLTGGSNPTGTVDFTLYSDSSCKVAASPAVDSGNVDLVSGSASYSTSWTPSSTGTYYWGVTYSGDTNNTAASACGGDKETLTVGKASPTIATDSSGVEGTVTSGAVGSTFAVGDTATLTGFSNLVSGDTITFNLYGPTSAKPDGTCNTDDRVLGPFTESLDTATGTASTGPHNFTPTSVGTYYWVASFAGDANNNGPVTEACGDSTEAVTVAAVSPTLATNASTLEGAVTSGIVGNTLSVGDTGTLTGFANLLSGDTMSFSLYGPTSTSSPSCTNRVAGPFSGTVDAATGVANSGLHNWVPQAAGTYYWVATFSGDANNAPVTVGVGCGDSAEAVTVSKAQPLISTTPSISTAQAVPVTVSDTATVTGGFNPAGTVTFALYGPFTTAPSATDCSTNLVAGMAAFANVPLVNGSATSPGYPVTLSGIYQWVATFSDTSGNNLPAAGVCGDTTEQFTTFTAAVQPAVTPAKTGDMSIFMVLGIPFIVTGLILFGLSWRRREEQA